MAKNQNQNKKGLEQKPAAASAEAVVAKDVALQKDAKATTKKVQQKPKKNSKKAEKGPNRLVSKSKEVVSELKKVSWPSFKSVVKNTGVVITVVVVCALVLFGIDRLLGLLYTLIPG